jgi:hypothetical protein
MGKLILAWNREFSAIIDGALNISEMKEKGALKSD